MVKKLTILIPCFNEEKGIGQVIEKIPKEKLGLLGYACEIIVIDNNSTDRTSQIAKKHGANVVFEKRQGKGNAILTGFRNISKDTDLIVMLDGDNSYDSSEIFRLIEPLDSNFCDVVVGSRLHGKMCEESMKPINRVGNWMFTFLVRVLYQANVTDVCSGYFAWKKESLDRLVPYITATDFSVEMEMITKMARMGIDMNSVPISYSQREGVSSLQPASDGIRIFHELLKNLGWGISIPVLRPFPFKESIK
jgi:glycosyltransferase involved in cell wall biosynthesis